NVKGLPDEIGDLDIAALAEATDGLTGADLKRVVDDGKILYAFDVARDRATRPTTEYFLEAIETVRANKGRYAEAEARAREQRPERPAWFDAFPDMSAIVGQIGAPQLTEFFTTESGP